MLKRSFAESRAQMAAPETLAAITRAKEELAVLQQRTFPEGLLGTTREQMADFHAVCMRLQELTAQLQACPSSLSRSLADQPQQRRPHARAVDMEALPAPCLCRRLLGQRSWRCCKGAGWAEEETHTSYCLR